MIGDPASQASLCPRRHGTGTPWEARLVTVGENKRIMLLISEEMMRAGDANRPRMTSYSEKSVSYRARGSTRRSVSGSGEG
jgi:hypothetical protein